VLLLLLLLLPFLLWWSITVNTSGDLPTHISRQHESRCHL
jgi:hypothetical protein